MILYWLKNRSWISVIFVIAITVLLCFVFIKPQINVEAENRTKTSVYTDSEISYDIPQPTKEQLDTIEDESFVDSVFGYYYTETQIYHNGKNIKTKVLFSDYMQNVDFTMYSLARCIEKSDKVLLNPVFIDYAFAKNNNVQVEDQLKMGEILFDVQAVYETNTYFGSAILIPLVGAQKELIDAQGGSYSGAFIKVNDKNAAQNYWKTYKPYGRLKSPEMFSTPEAYEYHYQAWSSASYLNEITDFEEKGKSVLLETYPNKYIWSVLFVGLCFAFDIIISLRKSEKRFFVQKEYTKDTWLFYLFVWLVEVLISAAVLFVGELIIKNNVSVYVSNALMTQIYIQTGITIGVFAVLNLIWGIIIVKQKR